MTAAVGPHLRRSWREAVALPAPAFVLPGMPALLLVVVLPAVFERIAAVSGFGAVDYVTYLTPGAVALTAVLGGGFTAASLVTDVRDGFTDRLRLLGAPPAGMVLGRVGVEGLRVLPAAAVTLAAGVALGADLTAGVGIVVAITLAGLLSAAFSSVFHVAGLATGDPATATAMAPLGILLGFLSTALVPVAVVPAWAATVVDGNPVSVVVAGVRAALVGEVASSEVAAAAVVATAGIALGAATTVAVASTKTRRS